MSRDFESEIQAAEAVLQVTVDQLEQIAQEFITATAEFFRSWYWEEAQDQVKRKPDLTKKLGVEQLSKMKAEVKALQDDAPNIASEFLNEDSPWWHRTRKEHMYYGFNGNRPPDMLDTPLRLALGKLAPILEKYGYISAQGDPLTRISWREPLGSG